VTTREGTSPQSTSPTCEQRQAHLLLCPANCGCKHSLPRLAKKCRVSRTMDTEVEMLSTSRTRASPKVKLLQSSGRRQQYGLKTKIREFERVAAKQNVIKSDVQKFEFYVSGSNPETQCHLHVVPCEDADLALSMEITSSLRHSLLNYQNLPFFSNTIFSCPHSLCKRGESRSSPWETRHARSGQGSSLPIGFSAASSL